MSFDFDAIFSEALASGIRAAEPGGKAAKEWVRECAVANRETLRAIAEALLLRKITKDSAQMLFDENARTMRSEAAALAVIIKASAQAAINAFIESLMGALSSALKITL